MTDFRFTEIIVLHTPGDGDDKLVVYQSKPAARKPERPTSSLDELRQQHLRTRDGRVMPRPARR